MNETDFSTITLPDPPVEKVPFARKYAGVAVLAVATVSAAALVYAKVKKNQTDQETDEATAEEVVSA